MRIGIYGGSFDPIHKGHVNLVRELKKILKLDKVLVVPAHISPFKVDKPHIASVKDRFEMVKLAFEGEEGIEISDVEMRRKGVSYTIDTIYTIKEEYPKAELFLMLTEEVKPTFGRWKDHEQIEKLTKVIFISKEQIPWIDISSTLIREKLSKGERCDELLPPKVLDYINQHHLYWSP